MAAVQEVAVSALVGDAVGVGVIVGTVITAVDAGRFCHEGLGSG
jgi:hypothetical protein